MPAKENPFLSIIFNIIIPVLILNKATQWIPYLTPAHAVLIALSFPTIYGLKDYIKERVINWISVLALIGILFTGGFALLELEGIFFAIKEGALPTVAGIVVIGSVFYKKPFMNLFIKSDLFQKDIILQKIKDNKKEKEYAKLMNETTLYFSLSFFLSGALNFFIAKDVFVETDSPEILNEQIATMTWLGYVMIALPLAVISGLILWYLVASLKKMTNLDFNEMFAKQ